MSKISVKNGLRAFAAREGSFGAKGQLAPPRRGIARLPDAKTRSPETLSAHRGAPA